MEEEQRSNDIKAEILKGFRPGGVGMHGTFRGNIAAIREKGLLLPSERGMSNIQDNVIAYFTTPSHQLIDRTIQVAGRDLAADILLDVMRRQLGVNFGYSQKEGFYGEERLDWDKWEEMQDKLPAMIFFKDGGEAAPIEFPITEAAKGSYTGRLIFPEMRSLNSIDPLRILGSIELTPEEVKTIQGIHYTVTGLELMRMCRERMILKGLEFLIQKVR